MKLAFALATTALLLLAGCSGEKFKAPNIKNDFCGVEMPAKFCKCAFHDEYCESAGMDQGAAKIYVNAEYEAYVAKLRAIWETACIGSAKLVKGDRCVTQYGVIEHNDKLFLNAKPGQTLSITSEDLPEWARGQIATEGASVATALGPDYLGKGDDSVLLDGKPIARINDSTVQGGMIVQGSQNIFVNGKPVATIGSMVVSPRTVGSTPAVGGPIVTNMP